MIPITKSLFSSLVCFVLEIMVSLYACFLRFCLWLYVIFFSSCHCKCGGCIAALFILFVGLKGIYARTDGLAGYKPARAWWVGGVVFSFLVIVWLFGADIA